MKILIDGIFFQLAQTGISRLWTALLPRLAAKEGTEIILLDRGGCPSFPGIQRLPFPSYKYAHNASDSLLIDQIALDIGADVFSSTYYTTPVSIPSAMIVYDMIPETLGYDLSKRIWKEKELSIAFASRFLCISQHTRNDLLHRHPDLSQDQVTVAHCGIDREVFKPQSDENIKVFRHSHDLQRPYFLLVGSRAPAYKNAQLLFHALASDSLRDCDIVCAGGEPDIDPEWLKILPSNVSVKRFAFADKDLATAYSAAEALVYPSLYEGFGLPLAEAMACGCPAITTRNASMNEVAGDTALFISGSCPDELARALDQVRNPSVRKGLIGKGRERAGKFDWSEMTEAFHSTLVNAAADKPALGNFFAEWKRLRTIQAAVDTG